MADIQLAEMQARICAYEKWYETAHRAFSTYQLEREQIAIALGLLPTDSHAKIMAAIAELKTTKALRTGRMMTLEEPMVRS